MSYSPHGSTPGREYYEDYPSASPTPSPRGMFGIMPQQRPATRAHFRSTSIPYNSEFSSRMPTPSPRFNSQGEYATVSTSRSSREYSSSSSRHKRDRRSSISFTRVNSHWNTEGARDEDDVVYGRLPDGFVWVDRRSHQLHRQRKRSGSGYDTDYSYGGWQGGYTPTRDAGYASPRPEPVARPETRAEVRPEVRRTTSTRRNSTAANIPRPQTARPASSHRKPSSAHPAQPAHPPAQPPPRKATETDAKLHKIPTGYSLRHWDPSEQPICLLGSVFDANSLGKWIYDWTVFHHGPGTPLSEVAGDLWLLLIQLFGKLKRAEDTMPEIRSKEKKEMVEDFIQSGERLTDKLRKLLKACEAPMLKASKRDGKQLGHDAGIEFVLTLFGHEREMERTERLMQSLRLWILRFNANCEQVLNKPTL